MIHGLDPLTLNGPLTYRLTPNSLWLDTTFVHRKNRMHTVLCLRIAAILLSIILLSVFLHTPNRFTLGSTLTLSVLTIISFLVPVKPSPLPVYTHQRVQAVGRKNPMNERDTGAAADTPPEFYPINKTNGDGPDDGGE